MADIKIIGESTTLLNLELASIARWYNWGGGGEEGVIIYLFNLLVLLIQHNSEF